MPRFLKSKKFGGSRRAKDKHFVPESRSFPHPGVGLKAVAPAIIVDEPAVVSDDGPQRGVLFNLADEAEPAGTES